MQRWRLISHQVHTQLRSYTVQNKLRTIRKAHALLRETPEEKTSSKVKFEKKRPVNSYFRFVSEQRKLQTDPITNIKDFSRQMAEKWKSLSDEEKQRYKEEAAQGYQQYSEEKTKEKESTGKPKRPPSIFLIFAKEHRKLLTQQHPGLKNQEISKLLGEKYRNLSPEEKKKYEMQSLEGKLQYFAQKKEVS
jgi:hypothetical protein